MYLLDRLVDDLKGVSTTLFDTTACVYFLNEREPWATLVRVVLERAERSLLSVTIPTVVHLELLAKAFKNADELERKRIEIFVDGTQFVSAVPFTREVMLASAEIRGRLQFKLADSMVLGSACVAGVDALVGNDARFRAIASPEAGALNLARSGSMPRYLHLNDYIQPDEERT